MVRNELSDFKKQAGLCALKNNQGRLEILLSKRNFINPTNNKILSLPGEYVFPVGHCKKNESFEACAIREFNKKTNYNSYFNDITYFSSYLDVSQGNYFTEFYIAKLGYSDFKFKNNKEISNLLWISPLDAKNMIYSEKFKKELKNNYKKYNIKTERKIPKATLDVLSFMIQRKQKLLEYLQDKKVDFIDKSY